MAAKPFIVTPRIEEILHTVHYYRYMTAQDITKLLFSGGSLTHVRDILKVLCGGADAVDNQYLFRFPLSQFTTGKTEKVFTLGSKGRDYLIREGIPVNWYFKPGHTIHLSHGLIVHNLTLTRFLVCANIFSKNGDFKLFSTKICYELGKSEVIPDAWLFLRKQELIIRYFLKSTGERLISSASKNT